MKVWLANALSRWGWSLDDIMSGVVYLVILELIKPVVRV